jgi:hypothetical protein
MGNILDDYPEAAERIEEDFDMTPSDLKSWSRADFEQARATIEDRIRKKYPNIKPGMMNTVVNVLAEVLKRELRYRGTRAMYEETRARVAFSREFETIFMSSRSIYQIIPVGHDGARAVVINRKTGEVRKLKDPVRAVKYRIHQISKQQEKEVEK